MPSQNTKSVALTPQLSAWIDSLVDSGEFQSASEVVREGLRELRDKRERRAAELAEIRARIDAALDQADSGKFAEGTGEEAVRRAFAISRSRSAG